MKSKILNQYGFLIGAMRKVKATTRITALMLAVITSAPMALAQSSAIRPMPHAVSPTAVQNSLRPGVARQEPWGSEQARKST